MFPIFYTYKEQLIEIKFDCPRKEMSTTKINFNPQKCFVQKLKLYTAVLNRQKQTLLNIKENFCLHLGKLESFYLQIFF